MDYKADKKGNHAINCHCGPEMIRRHDSLIKYISELLHYINVKHKIEERNLFRHNNMKPADIRIDNLINGEISLVDVAVTNSIDSKIIENSNYNWCNYKPLTKARAKYNAKLNKYNEHLKLNQNILCDNNMRFRPLIFESNGGLLTETRLFFKRIADMISFTTGELPSDILGRMYLV